MLKRALIAALLIVPQTLSAQAVPCTVREHDDPICDQAAFQKTFNAARSVTMNSDKLDPYAAHQLHEMLTSMHKQIVPVGSHSELGFELTQPNTDGILVGPAGVILARLQVFGPGANRPLIWEETYLDQPDVPWQSAVLYLLRQFHDRFASSK